MDARRARDAEEAYLGKLRRALSCLTPILFLTRAAAPGDPERVGSLAQSPAILRASPALSLEFHLRYRLRRLTEEGHREVELTGYRYEVSERTGVELIAYHWHQTGNSPITRPHLHARIRGSSNDLGKLHLPTGFVTPAEVIRCLITEFGVEPLRSDWESILADD